MSSSIIVSTVCFALALGCAATARADRPAGKWSTGMPIVTYWAGPAAGFMAVNDLTISQLAAGGWNLGWADTPADLDVYQRHGVRAMLMIRTPNVDDPKQADALDSLVKQVKGHPALYAYYLVDEPGAGAFPGLAKLVGFLRKRDPAHLAYINLLPTYASDAQLNVTDDAAAKAKAGYPQNFAGAPDDGTSTRYSEYLRQFVGTVKPDLISYDHYHFMKNSDGAQYFLNLALIRKTALAAKVPFMNIIQTCDSPAEGWRGPGENELRWLTYTSLAYGAQAISHFRYDIGLWKDPKNPDAPLPLYWALSGINRDFIAIATHLQPLKSLGAYHCGTVPYGGEALPKASPFAPSPERQEILLGYFGKSAKSPTHVAVVNLDYKKAVTTMLVGPGPMEALHAPTSTWHALEGGNRVRLELAPGGGVLVRVSSSRKH